ncbi:hypothetical protein P9112_006701 [Eukaryota sp. TZLM1-RC]
MTLTLPQLSDLPGYTIVRPIGKGSYGRVFAAKSLSTFRSCCIKEVRLAEGQQDRWHREVSPMSLKLPYICSVWETFSFKNHYYIVMDLYPRNLTELIYQQQERTVLIKGTALSKNLAWKIFGQLVQAVQSLHQKNFCHRDIKPENIFLDDEFNAVLGDFGHSRTFTSVNLFTTAASPAYHAPEMYLNSYYGEEVDYFALGVIFFEMLVGELPYNPNSSDRSITPSALNKVADVEARKIIQQLMQPTPKPRATAFQNLYTKVCNMMSRPQGIETTISTGFSSQLEHSTYSQTSCDTAVTVLPSIPSSSSGKGRPPLSLPSLSRLSPGKQSNRLVTGIADGGRSQGKFFYVTLYLHSLQSVAGQTIQTAAQSFVDDEVIVEVDELISCKLFSIKCFCKTPCTVQKLKALVQGKSLQLSGTDIYCNVFLRQTEMVILLAQQPFNEVEQEILRYANGCSVLLRSSYPMDSNRFMVYEISLLSKQEKIHFANNLTKKCFPFIITYSVNVKLTHVFQIRFIPSADPARAQKFLHQQFNLENHNHILVVHNAVLLIFTNSPHCPIGIGNSFCIVDNNHQETNHTISCIEQYNSRKAISRVPKLKHSTAPNENNATSPKKAPSHLPTIKLYWKAHGNPSIEFLKRITNKYYSNMASSIFFGSISGGFLLVCISEST